MKKVILITISVFAIMLFALLAFSVGYAFYFNGVKNSDDNYKSLAAAEKLISVNPAEALKILGEVDYDALNDDYQAVYALLATQAHLELGETVVNDSLINIALSRLPLFLTVKDYDSPIYFAAARLAANRGDVAGVREYLQKCIGRLETRTSPDVELKYDALCLWISVGENNDVAYDKFLEARDLARDLQDSAKVAGAAVIIAKRFLDSGLVDRAYSVLNAENLTDNGETSFLMARISAMRNDLERSRQYVEEALSNINNKCDVSKIALSSAAMFLKSGDIDAADHYLSLFAADSSNCAMMSEYSSIKSKIEEKRGNYAGALKFQSDAMSWNDSLQTILADKNAQMSAMKSSNAVKEQQKLAVEADVKRANIILLIIIALAMAAVCTIFITDKHITTRIKRATEARDEMLNRRLLQMRSESESLVSRLNETIEHQSGEISDLMERNRMVNDRIFRMNEIVRKIESMREMSDKMKIKSQAQLVLTDEEMDNLIESFSLSYDKLPAKLKEKYPLLSEADIYLCCLIKMGVSNQDISLLLNVSEQTLKKRKYRLRHDKFGADSSVSLEYIINSIA